MTSPNKPSAPDFNTFELRAGTGDTTAWRGVRLQGSASALRPGDLREGVNIRPDGDGYRDRGGQAKIISAPADRGVEGIFEFGDVGAG